MSQMRMPLVSVTYDDAGAVNQCDHILDDSGILPNVVRSTTPEADNCSSLLNIWFSRVGTLTPTEARNIAADVLREVAKGADPSADHHAARQVITVGELCDWYLGDVAGRIKALVGAGNGPVAD